MKEDDRPPPGLARRVAREGGRARGPPPPPLFGNQKSVKAPPGNAAASPSMMQERERSRASASTIKWEPCGQVVAGTAVEPHSGVLLAGDDPEAIVLDFMQPYSAGRRPWRFRRQAGLDEPGRKSMRTRQHADLMDKQTKTGASGSSPCRETNCPMCYRCPVALPAGGIK